MSNLPRVMGSSLFLRTARIATSAAFVLLVSTGSTASAKFFLITHGDEVKDIASVAPALSGEAQDITEVPNTRVGFYYSHFGLFYLLKIWTWDGHYCLYQDNNVWEIEREEAARFAGTSVEELAPPFEYSYPIGLIVGIVAGLGWGGFKMAQNVSARKEERSEREATVASPVQAISSQIPEAESNDLDLRADHAHTGSAASTLTRLVSQEDLAATLRDPLYRNAIKLVMNDASSLSGLSTDPAKRQTELKKGLDYLVTHGLDRAEARPRLMAAVRAVARAQKKRLDQERSSK